MDDEQKGGDDLIVEDLELGVDGATVARRKSARKFITRNVAVTHDGAGFTPWLPIRAAVEYAAARRGFDWLAMVEDDSVLHLKRLRVLPGRLDHS